MQIILASESPRRTQLLRDAGIEHVTDPSNIDETIPPNIDVTEAAKFLAEEKALAVAGKYQEGLVVAADTVIVFGTQILGKPKDRQDAKGMIEMLSGKMHEVVTGFCVIDTASGMKQSKSCTTQITFKYLDDQQIENYLSLADDQLMDKAGSYALQEHGILLTERIEGDFFNVKGLPMLELLEVLEEFGYRAL